MWWYSYLFELVNVKEVKGYIYNSVRLLKYYMSLNIIRDYLLKLK